MDMNDVYDASQFTFAGGFDDQVQEILQCVRLTRQEVEDLQMLIDDLHQAFSQHWKGITIMLFGSIVTGLGIKSSDVDCYLQLPRWVEPPDRPLVIQAKHILMRHSKIFQELFAIINAKVPIVKFYHAPTERNCDISFTSHMGVQNSRLISYLLHLDKRALNLAILTKYWSKVHKLTGTNLLPNYCLIMLVVFYLQLKNILPSIFELQDNAPKLIINHWNAAYKNIQFSSSCNESLCQLLGGFFKYYSKFEFDKYIVSPFLGCVIDRKLFSKLDTIPVEFELYRNLSLSEEFKPIRLNTPMCIQDPFEHNRNCSVGVHMKMARNVVSHLSLAANIYDNNDDKSFLRLILQSADSNKNRQNEKKRKKPVNHHNDARYVNKNDSNSAGVSHKHGVRKQHRPSRNFTIYYKNKKKYLKPSQNNFR